MDENVSVEFSRAVLDEAQSYADFWSTCKKVRVGACIITKSRQTIFGCNRGVYNCKANGCRRVELYGNASKEHRLPSDCDALHSEIEAISTAAKKGLSTNGATIYVTRYPCEACARAIKAAGITKVIYGRKEEISAYTKSILEGVEVRHIKDWEREDSNE